MLSNKFVIQDGWVYLGRLGITWVNTSYIHLRSLAYNSHAMPGTNIGTCSCFGSTAIQPLFGVERSVALPVHGGIAEPYQR